MDSLNLETKVTAIILAGGKSQRMGTDKALLEINGKTLLEKTCEIAALCSNQIVIVTSWQERYRHLSLPHCEFVIEKGVSSPLQAFHLGMEVAIARDSWFLLLACDLPNLNSETLQLWSQALPQLNSQAYLAISDFPWDAYRRPSTQKSYWEALCGFYHASCYQSLTKYLQRSPVSFSFQSWLNELEITTIESVPEGMLFNCNYPEEWQEIRKSHRR
jgi:molybdenum cofactor guanylyltransferase